PDRFELAERLDELGAKHLGQELGARLPIPMLARERAAVRQHEVGGGVHKRPELLYAGSGLQIERDAAMNAAVAKMPKQRVDIIIFLEELVEVTQIVPEPVRRHRGILPGGPGLFDPRDSTGGDAGFTDLPDGLLFGRVCDKADARTIPVTALDVCHRCASLAACLGWRLAAKL